MALNENPYPPLPGVAEKAVEAVIAGNRYPDPSCRALIDALAAHLAVPTEHLAVGAGSAGLLYDLALTAAGPGAEIIFPELSFEAYPGAVAVSRAVPVPVPLAADRIDLTAMRTALTGRTRLILVCNPNNPTGSAIPLPELRAFLATVPDDVLVVVDEAYIEFAPPGIAALDLYRTRRNLVVLRTFSKAYGLAGLRVGYAVAHEKVTAALRRTAVPFAVSAPAQAAAIGALDLQAELRARVAGLVEERERVRAALSALGHPAGPSHANFLWLPLGLETERFAAEAAADGVRVRAYPGRGIRMTIADRAADDAFLAVVQRLSGTRRTT